MSAVARAGIVAGLVVCGCWVSAAPAPPPPLDTLLTRVGERVAAFYRRAQSVICLESSTVQPVTKNWSWEGMARTVESDLRVEADDAIGDAFPEAKVIREIRRINGRLPRERDKKDRTGCMDPNPLSSEPLAFLTPAHRGEYVFTRLREGKDKDRAALVIDFVSADRTSRLELIEDERGHDDCFDWKGPIATRGSVWVDADTHDVLRVERHLTGPVDLKVPWKLQRKYLFPPWIVMDRADTTLRYATVTFKDPEERLLLPESIESMTIVRGTLQSYRQTDTYTNYRRFLTSGRLRIPDR